MKTKINKAFTLVELIVVITILAILGTIGFISLQGYSSSARDSRRISDVGNIKTALELFVLDTGDYPLPDNPGEVYYSGDLLWTQGTIGENMAVNLGNTLKTKPLDPLFDIEYTYSVTSNRNEYQVMSLYENTISQTNTLINTSYAADTIIPKVEGNYNELFIETPGFIVPTPSIITSETLTTPLNIYEKQESINSMIVTGGTNFPDLGIPNITQQTGALIINLSVYTGSLTSGSTSAEKTAVITKIQDAYAGTTLSTNSIYANVINTTDPVILADRLILRNYTTISSGELPLITQTDCELAGWIWVDSIIDVYIGTTQGNGFCISPRFGDWDGDSNGISFNGWGESNNGWTGSTSDDDGNNPGITTAGQTRILKGADSLSNATDYICKSLGSAVDDFITSDTLVGRMKWLATNGSDYNEGLSIDWITGIFPVNGHVIPALFIADCIDGVKDLGTTMTYIHNDNSIDEITYSEYNTNRIDADDSENYQGCNEADTNTPDLDCVIYQNRQKYLLAWTQKKGSHLPSAFSYISNGDRGLGLGEYQVACDEGKLLSEDDGNDSEWIWLSGAGAPDGSYWGNEAPVLGRDGCSGFSDYYTGENGSEASARFVIRP